MHIKVINVSHSPTEHIGVINIVSKKYLVKAEEVAGTHE